MIHIALLQPQIPPNTGNIARLCAATGIQLHLVGPLGFQITDRRLKRAGLDYWHSVELSRHDDLESFLDKIPDHLLLFFSARASTSYVRAPFRQGSYLIFGNETSGLPTCVLRQFADRTYRIPMFQPSVRSLNLSSAVAIVAYEALRRLGRLE